MSYRQHVERLIHQPRITIPTQGAWSTIEPDGMRMRWQLLCVLIVLSAAIGFALCWMATK